MRARAVAAVVVLTLMATLVGCSSTRSTSTLTVYAAASLSRTFPRLGHEFEAEHPGTTVRFVFAGTADLLAQLREGAPADVLATADESTMARAVGAGLVRGDPRIFATNRLAVVTPPDNPRTVRGPGDLARPDVRLVVCAPQVPCGAATSQLAHRSGLTLHPVSQENAVTDVLGKVTSGQADAGIVYASDARGAGNRVQQVTIPEADQVVNRYPIAALGSARHPDALALLDHITGPRGRAALAADGFGAP